MSKILTLALLFSISLLALEIKTLTVEERTFFVNIELNSKIVQLSNTKHSIMSSLSGHIEEYYVKPASKEGIWYLLIYRTLLYLRSLYARIRCLVQVFFGSET